jgi:tetratricopeptide (TPR) repeat protein
MVQRKKVKTKISVKPSHRYMQAGLARLRENRYAEAQKAFQRALTLAQGTDELDGEDFARIEHLIGQCLRALGNVSAARVHFERALEQAEAFYGANDVALIPICTDLGDALRSLGDLADAKALYERALALDPEDSEVPFTLCGLGRVLEHLGDLQEAKASYQKALTIAETQQGAKYDARAAALLYLGNVLRLLGDGKRGIAYVKRGMALGKVAYAKEFPEAAATLSHIEIALEGGAVISRIVHKQAIRKAQGISSTSKGG